MPGTLDPVAFAKARTAEVLLLKKEIQDGGFRSARRVFQTLPRSMRRRAASYNIRRLPIRLRQRAIDEAAKDPDTVQKKIKKPPCRRRRRRTRHISETFGNRTKDKRWLETHLWHAKRARMENWWGYRIAVKSNEKCQRSCIRASQTKCFLYDSSYHEIIDFSSAFQTVFEIVNTEIARNINQAREDGADGHWHWQALLFHDQVAVGPGKVILTIKERTPSILIIAHPLIAENIIRRYPQANVLCGKYSIFELEGSQTPELLSCILEKPFVYSQLPSSAIYELNCVDPRFAFPQKPTGPCQTGDILSETTNFWNVDTEQALRRKSQKEINDLLSLHMIPGTKLQPTDDDPKMPTLVLMDSKVLGDGRRHHRWTVMVPNGWGAALWRSLIFAGARFGGLEEHQMVNIEHGRAIFPNDYPSSPAYLRFGEAKSLGLEDKWKRKPPAKRINYEKLGIENPFKIDLDLLGDKQKLRICRLECTQRGMPEWNGRVFKDDRLIGFITTGFYSQIHGKGVAFATCTLDQFEFPIHVFISGQEGPLRPAIITKAL